MGESMNRFAADTRQEQKEMKESYHLFWDLHPYLKPIFQGELCDTGWGTTD